MSLNDDSTSGLEPAQHQQVAPSDLSQVNFQDKFFFDFFSELDFLCPRATISRASIRELKMLCRFVTRKRDQMDNYLRNLPSIYEDLFATVFHKLPFPLRLQFIGRELPRDFETLNGFLYELILERTFAGI